MKATTFDDDLSIMRNNMTSISPYAALTGASGITVADVLRRIHAVPARSLKDLFVTTDMTQRLLLIFISKLLPEAQGNY